MFVRSHLNSALYVLKLYKGEQPFPLFLKSFFRQNKKYGSRDRKVISNLCYGYFRLGKVLTSTSLEDKILIAQFLCNQDSPFVHELRREWDTVASVSLNSKIAFLQGHLTVQQIFPWKDELSPEIDYDAYCLSFLIQPQLFLRIRPGNQFVVQNKLKQAGIEFKIESEHTLALQTAIKIEELLQVDKEIVIQDLNSQRVLHLLEAQILNKKKISTVWDCCAASGGKSILAFDTFPDIQLTVSDVRESILKNLHNRFQQAGIKHFDSYVLDVAAKDFSINKVFDVVICDAPCTGSGTWSRTPEQLHFFEFKSLSHYCELQKSISVHAAKAVKKGGYFLYITCSVFRQENEDVVKYIGDQTSLRLLDQTYLKGYESRADTLYTALFTL